MTRPAPVEEAYAAIRRQRLELLDHYAHGNVPPHRVCQAIAEDLERAASTLHTWGLLHRDRAMLRAAQGVLAVATGVLALGTLRRAELAEEPGPKALALWRLIHRAALGSTLPAEVLQ